MALEEKLLPILRGEKRAPFLSIGLAALSTVYRWIISARNYAYDKNWLFSTRLKAPVISIGNLAVGGTGKTPLAHLLATTLQDKVKLAILSRGYRSQIEKTGKVQQIAARNGPL